MRIFRQVLAVLVVLLLAPSASADVRDDARALALEGIRLLDAGEAEDALAKLEQAESTFHAPPHLLYIARAQRRLGRLVDAHRTLVKVMAEDVLDGAPPAFQKARQDAVVEATDLISKVPSLSIEVSGGTRPISVAVDGAPIPVSHLAFPVAVMAGSHEIVGNDGAGRRVSTSVEASAAGVKVPVLLDFAAPASDEPAPGPSPEPGGDDEVALGSFPVVGTVLISVGAAALVGGAITGALTLTEADDIKQSCNQNVCPPELEADADSAKTLGNLSTGLFIAGGIVAAAGVAVLIVELNAAEDEPEVGLQIRPGGLSLVGRF